MTRLPRTIRLDSSDLSVFERAAQPGEWAVAGGFLFMNRAGEVFTPAEHNAFASGFLGTGSFGWSTLVAVASASAADAEAVTGALAAYFQRELGAPSHREARAVAEQEVRFAASLCDHHAVGTLLTVSRRFEGEEIAERYATVTPHDDLALAHSAPIDVRALADAP
jgi:hypothetical protein